jgi:hypothetical protein
MLLPALLPASFGHGFASFTHQHLQTLLLLKRPDGTTSVVCPET